MLKYTLWLDYGCEGWKPYEYETFKECFLADKYGNDFRITKDVVIQVIEKDGE